MDSALDVCYTRVQCAIIPRRRMPHPRDMQTSRFFLPPGYGLTCRSVVNTGLWTSPHKILTSTCRLFARAGPNAAAHAQLRPVRRVLKRGVRHRSVGAQGYAIGPRACGLATGSIPLTATLYKECFNNETIFKGVFFKTLSLSTYSATVPGEVRVGKSGGAMGLIFRFITV